MAIHQYSGETFVGFLDISGFKELMKQKDGALKALDKLYQTGYDIIREGAGIEGLFISDCGILFVRDTDNKLESFKRLMKGIKKINQAMLVDDFMTVSSVSFGQFKYQNKLEIRGIEKNAIYGGAYVNSYLDVENGEPKIKPGQCRVLQKGLPEDVISYLKAQDDSFSKLFRCNKKDPGHFYYYWSVETEEQIDDFEQQVNDSYKLVYQGILDSLKKYSHAEQ